MAVGVVDGLEVVQVHHEHCQGISRAAGPLELLGQTLQPESPVVPAGQRIQGSHLLQVLVVEGIVQRHAQPREAGIQNPGQVPVRRFQPGDKQDPDGGHPGPDRDDPHFVGHDVDQCRSDHDIPRQGDLQGVTGAQHPQDRGRRRQAVGV